MKLFENIRNHYDDITRVFLLIISIVILVLIFPKEGQFKYEFQKGKPWMHEDLIAPFDFAILKSDAELESEKQQVLDALKPYFNYEESILPEQLDLAEDLFNESWESKYGNDRIFLQQRIENQAIAERILTDVYKQGIIEINPAIEDEDPDYEITLLKNNVASEVELQSVLTLQSAHNTITEMLSQQDSIDQVLISNILLSVLKHNIIYDEIKTIDEQESQLSNISLTMGLVQEGERIVSEGELITESKFMILSSLKKNYESQLTSTEAYYSILGGQIILISIALLVLYFFLMFFHKDITGQTKKLVLVLSIIISMVLITSLVVKFDVNYLFLIPVCIVPILIRALFDARLALYIHLITIIITAYLVPNSFSFVFIQLIAGIVAIMSMVNLERRSQFFITSIWIFLSYSLVYIGMTLIQEGDINTLRFYDFMYLAIGSVLTLFAFPLIFVFEKVFGIITDVTLIELSNTNNKLLRELATKAPGTFQHSMQVANLAESAIYEIGGNALLVRTGAMYHDIGKMDMPMYFIENQSTGLNPHDELTFEESARIIISHVIKGVEMAKKHNLPEDIIDFIRTHHGNRKVEYFYIMQQREDPDEKIDDSLYTYPGPIPFSKETAVLMMADSVEAASRSLNKPDEEKINSLVEGIINKQVETGQFINSDITLRDITRVKKILKKKLVNILHVRIAYPE